VTRDEGPLLVLRADGGSTIGLGHAMRMIALGEAWIEHGGRANWLVADAPGSVVERAVAAGIDVARLATAPGSAADATAVLDRLAGDRTAAIVADGPAFDVAYLDALAPVADRLMVVDDMASLAGYPTALVLNQNAHADRASYPPDSGPRYLLGLRYVMLRHEFRREIAPRRPVQGRAGRVLVTFGGADVAGLTMRTIHAIERLDPSLTRDLEIDVVIGAANADAASIERSAALSPIALSVARAVDDMPTRMARADLAIVSGGSTVWELARVGCPALVIESAPAEAFLVRGLAKVGLFDRLGPAAELADDTLVAAIARRLEDVEWRTAMARLGPELVDGHGADRVVAELRNLEELPSDA
jgi:UDP-2,4-diacetamido-2,4,6-trideoxy-beta-L-altropyranose hydrolase